jgi:signal transduction histidine kinase
MPVLPDRETHENLFSASIAHELKTPLAALQASSVSLRKNIEAMMLLMLSQDPSAGTWMRDLASATLGVLRARTGEGPSTGLLQQSRVDAASEVLARAGLARGVDEAARAIVRGGWEAQVDLLAPIFARADAGAVIQFLDAVSKLRSNVRSIEASVARLAGIVVALRERPGGASSEGSGFDLRSCIGDTLDTLRHAVPSWARIEVRCDEGLALMGDSARFGQVLTNLVCNALAALPESGGEVRVEGERTGTGAIVRVIDDGAGIPAAVQSALFSPFFTTKPGGIGTGLGLFIAREIVEEMGGTVRFESRAGRTCFEMRMPLPPPGDGEI